MKLKRGVFAIGVGALVSFVIGGALYGLVLHDVLVGLSLDGFYREGPNVLGLGGASVLLAAAMTLVVSHAPGRQSVAGGALAGLILGLLIGGSVNLALYAASNAFNSLLGVVVEIFGTAVVWVAAGTGVGWVFGKQSDDL